MNSSTNVKFTGQINPENAKITNLTNNQKYSFKILTVDINDKKSSGIIKVATPKNNLISNLTENDLNSKSNYGYSVAISGDYAVVGSPKNNYDDSGNFEFCSGAAYIYKKSAIGNKWELLKKVTPSDRDYEDEFGFAVSISGNYIVVSSIKKRAVYLFQKDKGGVDNWGQYKKIQASDDSLKNGFGKSVSIDGDYFVVGSPNDSTYGLYNGAIYIFYRNQGGENNWGETNKIIKHDNTATYDFFGHSVSISSDRIISGAYGADDNGTYRGIAYIFKRLNLTNNWQTEKYLSIGSFSTKYGYSVAISGNYAVVGAYEQMTTITHTGAAYIYSKDKDGINNWGLIKSIFPEYGFYGDKFGHSVAISNENIIIGSYAAYKSIASQKTGLAYIFNINNGGAENCGLVKTLTISNGKENDYFGYSVAISAEDAIVGACQYEDSEVESPNYDSGAAYLYSEHIDGTNNWGLYTWTSDK